MTAALRQSLPDTEPQTAAELAAPSPLRPNPAATKATLAAQPLGLVLLPPAPAPPPPARPLRDDEAVARLAAALGLKATPGLVRFDRAGFPSATGRGRVEGGRIVLHPDRFHAGLPEGRNVLAHELAHLAQARLAPGSTSGGAASLIEAELEALELGRRAADGLSLSAVRKPVPAAAVMFDDSLADVVGRRYATELARFQNLLRGWLGFLWVTDGAIREALTLVEGLDFEVIRAFGSLLTDDQRATFLDNVSPGHFARFRREILAIYSVTQASLIRRQDESLFRGMDFSGLEPAEVVALNAIFAKEYPATAIARLRDDPEQGPHLRRILDTDLSDRAAAAYDAASAEARAQTALEADLAARAAAAKAARQDETGAAAIEQLKTLLRDPGDAERITALDTLSGFLGRPQIFEGILESVQPPEAAEGPLDRMLDGFPGRALVEPVATPPEGGPSYSRIETLLRVAALRPPWKNVALIESLLSSAWIFNVITSSEALLAFQLAKALPDSVRAGLLEEDSGRLGSLLRSSLSQSMREAAGTNFYRGGEGRLDLASIQTQLMDDGLWVPDQIGRLSGLIRMAGAAGEQEWVFNRSRQISEANPVAYEATTFRARIVEPFMLYGSTIRGDGGGQRTAWEPAYGDWAVEDVWDMLGESFATIGRGIAVLGSSRDPGAMIGNALFGRSLRGDGLSAVALQNLLGGSFMGIRFVSPEDRIDDPALAAEIARADEADRGVNYIDRALWDTDRGVLEMQAGNLAVAAIRYPLGDMLISTGPGRITGMALTLGYPTRETGPRPTTMDLRISMLELNDLLIVQRGSMLGINRVDLRGLEVDLGRDAITNQLPEAGEGVDPWTLNPITPILRLIGLTLGSEFADRSAEIATALAEPAFATPMMISVDRLTLTGVLTSGGQYVETVGIEEAQIGIAGTVDDYYQILWQSMRATVAHKVRLMRSLEGMPEGDARTHVEARIDKLAQRVEALQQVRRDITAAQGTVAELGPQERSLSPADNERLRSARAALAPYRAGGITFDAGRLHVAGLQGRVTGSDVDVTDIHGRGQGAAGLLAFLTDSEALGRIIEGPAHVNATAPELGREHADFTLELGDLTLDEVRIGAGIPTVADAEGARTAAEQALAERSWDPALIAARDEAAARATATRRYHELAAAGATYLSPTEAREMTELHDQLLAAEAFYLHHLDTTDARLGFSARDGTIRFGAGTFVASGDGENGIPAIRAGGTTVARAEGRNVDLSIGVTGGLHNFSDFVSRLGTIGLSGDFVRLEGISHAASGTTVAAAEGAGFDLSLDAQAGVFRGSGDRLGAEGVRSRITRPWLMEQIIALEAKPAERVTEADRTTLRALHEALDILDAFETGLAENAAELAAATDPATRTRLQTERQTSIEMFLYWEGRIGARTAEIRDLDVEVSGLGNLAGNGFDFGAAIDSGITIRGRGRGRDRDDRIFSGASVTDARFGGLQAGEIALGETAGRIRYSTREIALDDLGIENLTLGALLWTSRSEVAEALGGGATITQIFSYGSTVASGIRVSARLQFVPTVEDPDQYRLEHVSIGPMRVERLEADGLGYGSTRHPPVFGMADPHGIYTGQDYTLDGGAIIGIWAEGIEIDMPDTADEDMRITGLAGIESISGTRASAFIEDTLTGHARLDGSALSIQFLESGGQIIDIGTRTEENGRVSYEGGLRLSEGEVSLPQGSAGFSTGTITGRIVREGAVTRFEGISVPSVTLQRMNFATGDRSLSASSPVRLADIRVDASYDGSERGNSQLSIDRLRIATISGDDLSVTWPPYSVRIRQDPALVRRAAAAGTEVAPPLQVAGVEIDNLHWSARGGVTPAEGADRAHIGIDSVQTAFDLIGADMDLDAVIDADGLRFDFLRDGTQELQINELDASFRGQAAAGVEIDTTIQDLATGVVTINGRTITVPALSLPMLTLDHLSVTRPGLQLDVPTYGGRIVLTGTRLNAEILMAEPTSHAPFEQLTINSLVVPTVTMQGIRLVLPDQVTAADGATSDLILTVPASETVTITNLTLGAMPGGAAFVITPDPTGAAGPQIDGRLHFDRAQGKQLGLEIERQLHATSDIDASTLDFDFLGAGGFQFTLAELELTQTTVGLGEYGGAAADHIFNITTGTGGSERATSPHATIRGLSYGSDGSVAISSAALAGLVYLRPDWGVRLDVGAAELPAQADGRFPISYVPGDRLIIPELTVTDAAFTVDDLMAIGGGSSGGSSAPVLDNLDFLDALDGTVGLTLGHPSLPDMVSERLNLRLEHGNFDLDQIENEIGLDFLIDFDLEDDRLVLNIDYGNVTLATSILPFLNYEVAAFHLREQSEIDEAARRRISLSTMVERFESSGSSGEVSLSIRDIDADLTLEQTRVDLAGHGSILMGGAGRDGALGIDVTGGLYPSTSGHGSQLDIAIEEVNASIDPNNPLTFGGVTAQSGELTITNVHDTHLTFHGVTQPRRLSGVIGGAVIRNVEIGGL